MADVRIDFGFDDLDKANKLLKDLQKAAKNISASMKQTGKVVEADLQKAKQYATATKKIATEKKKLTAVEKEQLRLERALESTEAKIKLATSKTNKQLIEKKKQLLSINRELRTGSKNTASWGKALGSFQFKFNALGNIASSVTSVISRSINRALRDAVNIVKDFDQAMADVKAITGATGKEFDQLSKSAQSLGGTTKFTATEVSRLQKEYAKLGLTTKQILAAQAATLDLAAATNTELPRAAEVVGITIKQFGLEASEAQRVADVMARSFTSSALDMEKFAEAMKFVGPAAKASGISIERTTAILGQLADAGISGSMAGTSLRQIMLALSKESGTFSEKIERAAKSGLTLAGAAEEVQKRAATALLVMADGTDTIDDFTESLEGAAGAAREMADVQLDTLAGQATLVKSAWEGMILAMLNTEENLNGVKWALGGIVTLLNALALRAETGFKLSEALAIEVAVQKAIEDAEESLNNQALTVDELKSGWTQVKNVVKDLGKDVWSQLFPKDPEVIEDLEDINSLLKQLDEFRFKEEDQEAIGIDVSRGFAVSDETNAEAEKTIEDLAQLQGNAIADQVKEAQDAEDKKTRIAKDGADKRNAIVQDSFNLASNLTSSLSSLFKSAKEKELSAAGDNAKKREEIEKKFAKREQSLAVASALINGAEAITQIWSKWAANPAIAATFTALAAGTTAAQLAVIKNQKFAEGEIDINGPSHSRGGIIAEIEGGESVINKRSTGKYKDLLDAINQDDQARIMSSMDRDRKIEIKPKNDPYLRKLYEHTVKQVNSWEDDSFYYVKKGNMTRKFKK